MKNLNVFKFSTVLCLGLTLSLSLNPVVYAQTPAPSAPTTGTGQVVHLNPNSLRKYLLMNNNSLLEGVNQVALSKQSINVARANLLPSLNITGLLNPSTFIISAIQFLLPFLLPSNWFNLSSSKRAFDAQKEAYKVLQLNTYSSVLSMYYTALADQQTRDIYLSQAQDFDAIYQRIRLAYSIGQANADDLRNAQSQALLSKALASQWVAANQTEIAAVKSALALPTSAGLVFDANANMPSSKFEGGDVQKAIDYADNVAPERVQLQYLIRATKGQKFSQLFSFINSATLGSGSSSGTGGATTTNLTARAGVGFSFTIFPSIQISNLNVKMLQLQDADVTQANQRILEGTVLNISEALSQLDFASQSADLMNGVYQSRLLAYKIGFATFDNVLLARTQMTQSLITKAAAALNVNLLRVVLHRALLSDQFALVKGCREDANAPYGHFFKDLFGGHKAVSMDDVCRGSGEDDESVTATPAAPSTVADVNSPDSDADEDNTEN